MGRKGATENEVIGWHHQLNGREFEQTPGESEGQGSLVCCSPWGHKELDVSVTEQQQSSTSFSFCPPQFEETGVCITF